MVAVIAVVVVLHDDRRQSWEVNAEESDRERRVVRVEVEWM